MLFSSLEEAMFLCDRSDDPPMFVKVFGLIANVVPRRRLGTVLKVDDILTLN